MIPYKTTEIPYKIIGIPRTITVDILSDYQTYFVHWFSVGDLPYLDFHYYENIDGNACRSGIFIRATGGIICQYRYRSECHVCWHRGKNDRDSIHL